MAVEPFVFDPSNLNPDRGDFATQFANAVKLNKQANSTPGSIFASPLYVRDTGSLTPDQISLVKSMGGSLVDPTQYQALNNQRQSAVDENSKINYGDIAKIGGITIGAGLLGGGALGAGPLAGLFGAGGAGALGASAATPAGTVALGGGAAAGGAGVGSLITSLLGTALPALAGAFGSQQSATNNSTQSSTSTPNLSSQQQELINAIIAHATNQYNQGTDLTGYTSAGLKSINNNSLTQSKVVQNLLASRGLSYSPEAVTALAKPQSDKLAQSSSFLSTIPLLQQQLKETSLQDLMKSFGLLPTATSTSNTGTGQQIQSGSPIAGALSGAGAGLFTSGLAPILANLFKGSGGTGTGGISDLSGTSVNIPNAFGYLGNS